MTAEVIGRLRRLSTHQVVDRSNSGARHVHLMMSGLERSDSSCYEGGSFEAKRFQDITGDLDCGQPY